MVYLLRVSSGGVLDLLWFEGIIADWFMHARMYCICVFDRINRVLRCGLNTK